MASNDSDSGRRPVIGLTTYLEQAKQGVWDVRAAFLPQQYFDAVTASFFALPSRADAPDAASAFGVARTPLVDGLRATLEAAAAIDTG